MATEKRFLLLAVGLVRELTSYVFDSEPSEGCERLLIRLPNREKAIAVVTVPINPEGAIKADYVDGISRTFQNGDMAARIAREISRYVRSIAPSEEKAS